ncbi:hypothetical protein CEE45_14460 [Candidatus Heimdallarchaeota archaeon B3_Heim]|nr:MAG: hypothetical protein CEE45_14460 [Candidatus Heimdallarchaeota archaeon B3_Heim]
MIESESSLIDSISINEFSPPDVKNWEIQIRVLVRIASISFFILFILKIFEANLPIFAEISVGVVVFILGIFIIGLVVGFFQLRYINVRRNKLTNFGGLIGFAGLFLTGIPCSCELVVKGFFSSSLLDILLVSGLFLTFLGFFAEVTQLDQIFIYFIRISYRLIIQYTLSGIGAFLVNFGMLFIYVWPRDLVGIWAVLIGLLILWGTWFNQINQLIWQNKVHIMRTSELSISGIFLLYMLFSPIFSVLVSDPDINIETLFVSVVSGIICLSILYLDLYFFRVPDNYQKMSDRFFQRFLFLFWISAVSLILIGSLYPQSFLQALRDLSSIFRISYLGVGLLVIYRVWFKGINQFLVNTARTFITVTKYLWSIRMGIVRGSMTVSGVVLIVLPLTSQMHFLDLPIRYFLIIVGIGILYLAWLSQVNEAIIHTVRTTKRTLVAFGHFVWDTGVAIKQAFISFFQYLWFIRINLLRGTMTLSGGLLSVYAFASPSLGSLLQPVLFILGLIILYTAWFVQVNDFLKRVASAIFAGLVSFGHRIWDTGVAIKEAILSFAQYLWLIRMKLLRGTMTLTGGFLTVYAFLSPSLGSLLQPVLFILGLIILYAAWFVQFNDYLRRTVSALYKGLVSLGHRIWEIGVTIKEAIVSFAQYLWLIRIEVFRAGMTIGGPFVMMFSFFTPSLGLILQGVLFVSGLAIFYLAWFSQINMIFIRMLRSFYDRLKMFSHFVWDLGIALKERVIALAQYIWLMRVVILRVILTIIGPIFMLYGLLTPSLGLFLQGCLFIGGLALFYIAWFNPINSWVINLAQSLRDGLIRIGHLIRKTGVSIKHALVSFSIYLWSVRMGVSRGLLTILGTFSLSYLIFTPSLEFIYQILFLFLGISLLYLAWFAQVNAFIIQTGRMFKNALVSLGTFIWDTGVAIKQAFISFFQYLWFIRINLLRGIMTLSGVFLSIYAFASPSLGSLLQPVLFILGLIFLYAAWFVQVNDFIIQTARAIKASFVSIGMFLLRTVRAIKQGIIDFSYYLWSLRIKILRLGMTISGVILDFLGLSIILNDLGLSVLLIVLGTSLLIIAWTKQIINILELAGQALINAFKALLDFGSRIVEQTLKLIGTLLDSIIYIAIVTLGVTAFGYGVILLVSGFLGDQGDWTKTVISPIPIFGDILWIFAAILQGKSVNDVDNLVGIFANDPTFVLLLLGLIFIIVGAFIPFITFFSRDSIKISNLQKRFGSSTTDKEEMFYEGKKGGKK